MKGKGFRLETKGERLELDLYGVVGDPWGDGIDAAKVVALLRNNEDVKDITVRINSMGGVVWDGTAIMDALKDHAAKVTVKVDGIAASAASIIAMAGDRIEMGEGAFLMVHRPRGFAMGEATEMLRVAELLEKVEGEVVNIYARRSGQDVETARAWVQDETWFTGQEAVAAGLADEAVEDPESQARAARAYAEQRGAIWNYAHMPEAIRSLAEAHKEEGGDPPPETEEGYPMSDLAKVTSAELAEARPDLAEAIRSEALKGAAEDVEKAVKTERERASGIAAKATELKSDVDVAQLIADGTELPKAWEQMLVAKQEELHDGAKASAVGQNETQAAGTNPFLPR